MNGQVVVQGQGQEQEAGQQVDAQSSVREFLRQLSSRELMDALMAADMPMGGTNEQRIERLLSVMQPRDLVQYLPVSVLKRVSPAVGLSSPQ
jgi:hypothetical protein